MKNPTALYFVSFIFLFVLLPQQAFALEINEEGAKKLQSIFEDFISHQKTVNSLTENSEMKFDGTVSVEPSGTYYAVTLPHTTIVYPREGRMEIGMISINAAPHDQPAQWKMSLAIPTPMVRLDEEGMPLMRINIGSQRAAGIWHENMQGFVKLDAKYQDITITGNDPAYSFRIPQTDIRYDFQDDQNGRWSGPGYIMMNNIDMDIAGEGAKGTIGQMKMDFNLDQYDPGVMQNYKEQIAAITENTSPDQTSPQHAMGLYNMVFDTLLKSGNGFGTTYSVSDVHLRRKSLTGDPDGTLDLNKAHFGFDLSGFLNDDVSFSAKFGFEGFEIKPKPTEYEKLSPTDLNINIALEKIPFGQVSALGKNTLQGAAQQPQMAGLAGLSLMMKLPAILAQAGTYMEIKDNHLSGRDYRIDLNGKAKADISAVNSITADAKLVFDGLDKVITRTEAIASDPEHEQAERFLEINKQLQMLKNLAKIEKKDDNAFLHVFEFVMDPQGQMLLNGKNLFQALKGETTDETSGQSSAENVGDDSVQPE